MERKKREMVQSMYEARDDKDEKGDREGEKWK